jgi:hypothetical protein
MPSTLTDNIARVFEMFQEQADLLETLWNRLLRLRITAEKDREAAVKMVTMAEEAGIDAPGFRLQEAIHTGKVEAYDQALLGHVVGNVRSGKDWSPDGCDCNHWAFWVCEVCSDGGHKNQCLCHGTRDDV